jgi:SAM-dependent methyltransferase
VLTDSPEYLCGHTPRELERLESQAGFFEEITRVFLERAGLEPGMRVLDVGCGVGDVSFLAADLVGQNGSVLGVDRALEPLAVARSRATARGLSRVTFRLGTLDVPLAAVRVDALIGRFVLMHQPEPARALRAVAAHVRPGGLVAFLESDLAALAAGAPSRPVAPTYDRVIRWMVRVIEAAGAHADVGLRLREIFLCAGLPAPTLWLQAPVEGGSDAAIVRYTCESVRSMLPTARRCGLGSPTGGSLDDLEQQLTQELASGGGVLLGPPVVGAWCRRAQDGGQALPRHLP